MLKHLKIDFDPRFQLSITHILRDVPIKVSVNVFLAHQPDSLPRFFLQIGQSNLDSEEILVRITLHKCFFLPRSLEPTSFNLMVLRQLY
jgi:hypothetical protein